MKEEQLRIAPSLCVYNVTLRIVGHPVQKGFIFYVKDS